jgi:hypothetical protein
VSQDQGAKNATTLREVGLAPETGATAPDLVEVDGFTKEVIGREVVVRVAAVEAATILKKRDGVEIRELPYPMKKGRVLEEAAGQARETEKAAMVATDISITEAT